MSTSWSQVGLVMGPGLWWQRWRHGMGGMGSMVSLRGCLQGRTAGEHQDPCL